MSSAGRASASHQEGTGWTDGQASGAPGDGCPGRESAMEPLTASARPQNPPKGTTRFDPDPVE